MIGVTLSGKAYAAIADELPALSAVAKEVAPDGEYYVWLPDLAVERLRALRWARRDLQRCDSAISGARIVGQRHAIVWNVGLDASVLRHNHPAIPGEGKREEQVPIRRYMEGGVVFGPAVLSAMNKAFEAAIWTLGPDSDEMKRESVARAIIQLAREGDFDAASLHRRAIAAISDPPADALAGRSQDNRSPTP